MGQTGHPRAHIPADAEEGTLVGRVVAEDVHEHRAGVVGVEVFKIAAVEADAFDFLAGTKKEAPAFLRHSGFEWLFRLVCEPRRLWRRYLFGNLRFLRGLLRFGVHLT